MVNYTSILYQLQEAFSEDMMIALQILDSEAKEEREISLFSPRASASAAPCPPPHTCILRVAMHLDSSSAAWHIHVINSSKDRVQHVRACAWASL